MVERGGLMVERGADGGERGLPYTWKGMDDEFPWISCPHLYQGGSERDDRVYNRNKYSHLIFC